MIIGVGGGCVLILVFMVCCMLTYKRRLKSKYGLYLHPDEDFVVRINFISPFESYTKDFYIIFFLTNLKQKSVYQESIILKYPVHSRNTSVHHMASNTGLQ